MGALVANIFIFFFAVPPPTGQPPPMHPSQELLPPPPVPRDVGYGGQPQFMPHNGAAAPMMAPTPMQSMPRGPPSFNPSPVPTPPPQYAPGPPPGGNPSRAGPQPGDP